MGQFVSSSEVVQEVTGGERQFFTEHNGSFVPVIASKAVYRVVLGSKVDGAVCDLRNASSRFQVELQREKAAESYVFSLDRPCLAGFYRLKCLDIDTEVYVEGQKPPKELKFPAMDSWLPDGYDYRKLIKSLEENIGSLHKNPSWKSFLENLIKLNDHLMSMGSICSSLQGFQISLPNNQNHPLQSIFNIDFQLWLQSFKSTNVDQLSQSLSKKVILPLQEFVEFEKQNQKTLPKKQKSFSEAMKSMYSSQSTSPLTAKLNYELARLEYQDFLYQSYIIGPHLLKLYNSVSSFLNCPINEKISRTNDLYAKHNNQLRTSIKRSKSLEDLIRTYSSVRVPHKENYLLVRTSSNDHENTMTNVSTGGSNSSSGSHWHKRWAILDGPFLTIFQSSKKVPFQLIELSFACIKQTNKTVLEIITSGSTSQMSLLMSVNSSSSSSDHESAAGRMRIHLQFKDESEAKSWLDAFQQSNTDTKQSLNMNATAGSSAKRNIKSQDTLIDLVMRQHESNSLCCDCGNSETVEWISISLLCVLCIKCSGVHRSMGSHISKVRSLTLDNFTSPEILHLLQNNVSNANVNSIYESRLIKGSKIRSTSSDSERSQYIIDKYQRRKMVEEGDQNGKTSLKSLIKAIHLNSIFFLQKTIAQSKLPLREVITEQTRADEIPTIFQYSLKHHEMVNGKPVFFITEFLLYNGLPVDKLPNNTVNWSSGVLDYWRSKIDIYGTNSTVSQSKSPASRDPQLSSLVIPEKAPNRRWTLNHMPSSPQIKSPTNLLNMHKSLKLTKRGAGKKEQP